jgi:hypothetical protein
VPAVTLGCVGVAGVESYVAIGAELILSRFTELLVAARWVGVELTTRWTALLVTV